MHDNVVFRFEFEVRDVELAHGVQRRNDRAVALCSGARGAKLALDTPQRTQHARAVEALTFTMFAEAHTAHCIWAAGRPSHLDEAEALYGQEPVTVR